MKLFRRLISLTAIMAVLGIMGIQSARADVSVYNTPGGHLVGGRLWNTTCEMYSATVVRCRTNIWATQVRYVNGTYKPVTGWYFNSLTYLPAPRATWAGNNLGQDAEWTTTDGRRWRTECDTPATGYNNCRTWAEATVIQARPGGGYTTVKKWVLNNIVQFSSPTNPPVTAVPAWVIDQSRLDFTGLGPLQRGAMMDDLTKLGYFVKHVTDACTSYMPSQSLQNREIDVLVDWVNLTTPKLDTLIIQGSSVKTVDGAHVGMTYAQVKAIYGSRMQLETKDGYEPVYTAVVDDGSGRELVFLNGFDLDRPLVGSDVITMIVAQPSSDWLGWDGC